MESGITPDEVSTLYAEITALRGGLVNLYRALANQPPALRAFMGMSRYVRDESSLTPQLRELAILATAHALDVEYEKVHHLAAARRIGVAERKLQAFPNWAASDAFTPAERAVLAYSHQVTRSLTADDATFNTLREYLTPAQVVDLTLTVGWYHLCAALILPLRIDLD